MEDADNDNDAAIGAGNNNNATPTIGRGAAKSKDWYAYLDTVRTNGTQADKLPKIGSFVLYKLEPPLKNKEDFDNWYNGVYKILRGHHLHRLIDKNIERPDTDADNAEDWVTLSIQVTGWLTQCIDPDIANDLINSGERVELADDFMYQLKLYMRGEGYTALSTAMMKLFRTQRTEFTTVSEFIDGVKQRFKAANDLKAKLHPYTALVIMMSELEQIPEMNNGIEIKINEMKSIKDPATEISMKDYLKICTEMHDKTKALGIDGLGASATKASRNQFSRQSASTSTSTPTSDGRKDKLMNAPPPGKYAKKHVEEWKNHKPSAQLMAPVLTAVRRAMTLKIAIIGPRESSTKLEAKAWFMVLEIP
jgi:hypothetical protein